MPTHPFEPAALLTEAELPCIANITRVRKAFMRAAKRTLYDRGIMPHRLSLIVSMRGLVVIIHSLFRYHTFVRLKRHDTFCHHSSLLGLRVSRPVAFSPPHFELPNVVSAFAPSRFPPPFCRASFFPIRPHTTILNFHFQNRELEPTLCTVLALIIQRTIAS